jgi:putative flippase GtrA
MRQFVQYVIVGGLAFVVDFAVLYLLTDQVGLHYLLSASIAFLLGLCVNYLLCVVWIFDFRVMNSRAHEFAIFGLVGVAGLALNNMLMWVLTDLADLHYLASKLVAAALILLFNFSARRSILFTDWRSS